MLMEDMSLVLCFHYLAQANTKTSLLRQIPGTGAWMQVDGSDAWRAVLVPVTEGLDAEKRTRVM